MPNSFRFLFKILVWAVALMSGILSILREVLAIFYPNQVPQRSIFWSCVIIAFILSAALLLFQQYKKINILAKDLDEEKDRKKPKLNAEFNVLAAAPAGKKEEDSIIIIMATITNIGAPSIISSVNIIIKKGDREIHGEDVVLAAGPMFLEGEDLKITVKEEDNLVRRGISNPIPNGGALHGWHVVLVRNIQKEEIYLPSTTIIFKYMDVTGKLYLTEKQMDYAVSKLIDATKLQNK